LIKSEDEKDDPCDDVTSSDISKWMKTMILQKFEYRIYDHTSQNILANKIPTLEKAEEILRILKLDFPDDDMEIERYTA
jgi:hypothetical protein